MNMFVQQVMDPLVGVAHHEVIISTKIHTNTYTEHTVPDGGGDLSSTDTTFQPAPPPVYMYR